MPALLILFGIIALPLIEIGVFIAVGSQIGIGWTLALVVLSFVLGIVLLRRQGFSTLKAAQLEARSGVVPERPIVHGAMIVLAAILLVIPGFVTDIFGLLLFLPPVRDFLWSRLRRRVVVTTYRTGGAEAGRDARPPEVIDLSDAEFSRRDGATPWAGPQDDDDRDGRRTLH